MTCPVFDFMIPDISGQLNAMLRPDDSLENLVFVDNVHFLVTL